MWANDRRKKENAVLFEEQLVPYLIPKDTILLILCTCSMVIVAGVYLAVLLGQLRRENIRTPGETGDSDRDKRPART